jgi:hypothetical protein
MSGTAPAIKHFRPFLVSSPETYKPCRDFYVKIGFELLWESDTVAEFKTGFGDHRFLLTLHHGLVPTRVGVFHIQVDDVDEWYEHLNSLDLSSEFPTVKIAAPEITEWGWRLFYVWDPAGTLLHFGVPLAENGGVDK